ncbi:DUF4112 domain-containing protein [Stagnimonas aquatica]|uniref:DUF4112 domain-containing protein n=1 Tax=Stagnimonas aquatica TaxID=2689987 RepID=A0A3N0V162_9GAMM|nr:DUF4112 domain-containing protein [Stagnimonas aquatica]ROH86537.1 DUF4112 domain-containing protein [Stagnimonas aquatica]
MNPAPHPSLQRVEKLAYWLDEFITVPGTRFKIGLESLVGMIPVVGDVAGLLMGGYVVVEAHRLGAPAELKWKMVRNVALDGAIGLVPVLGDFFDFAYRSNRRNVQLLLGHYRPSALQRKAAPRRFRWLLLGLLLLAGLALWLLMTR